MATKLDQHSIVCAIQNMAIEIGRTPTRDEFCRSIYNGRKEITHLFGSYSALVLAAGLDLGRRKSLGNEIFERDLPQALNDFIPAEYNKPIAYAPTLAIGDTHFPWASERVLEAIYKFASDNKPKRIIQVGDLYDMYAHTRFPKSMNIYTPNQEEDMARAGAEKMWAEIKRICPDAECVQLKGNHDIRPVRRTMEQVPAMERAVVKYLNDLMRFDGVTLLEDERQEYFFDDVQVIHGHGSRLGQHRDWAMMNTIHGHTHKGGVVFRRFRGQTFWELDCGLVGDPESKAMSYTNQKMHDCTPGFGWIDNYGPRFISL